MKRNLLVVLGALGAQAVSAGVYVEMVDRDIASGNTELSQRMYVQNGLGRFVDAGGRATLIKNGTLYIIDDADKSYIAFDKATMEKLAKKINAAMAQMKDQLAKLPPEQRAQIEQTMPGMSGSDQKWVVQALDTGKSDTVDGRECRLWDIKTNEKLDKDRFRQDLGQVAEAYQEVARRLGILPEAGLRDLKGPETMQ